MIGTVRRRVRRWSALAAAAVALCLIATGCTATEVEPSPSPSATEVEIPDTPAGELTRWIIAELNADTDTDVADWEHRLHPDFLAEVTADQVVELLNVQIRPAQPFTATAYRGAEREAVTTLAGRIGEPFDLTVALDDAGMITTLFLGPVAPDREPLASLDDLPARLGALGGDARALVLLDGEELVAVDADEPAPIGSVFKLYVLAALADAVAAGTVAWDDTLTVTDDVRSLPSGELQDAPAGTTVSVRDAAEKMIAISDNTATDMIIGLVGRTAVERAVTALGHHDPALMHPFLTTREAFLLLWGAPDAVVARWTAGDEDERRAVLDELAALPLDVDVTALDDAAAWPQRIEWFATVGDLASAHDGLAERAELDPVIGEVLSVNPGVVIDATRWPTVAFKGGSSPGAVAGSWRAVRDDGVVLTVAVALADDDSAAVAATHTELFALVQDVFALVGASAD